MVTSYIFLNGIKMYLSVHEKEADTLIFLHCSGGNREQWNGVIEYFKDSYQIVVPDLRGHGLSSKQFSNYQLEAFALDIKAMMASLKIDSAHFIGSSLGGEVAVVLASIYPQLVKSIVCEGAIVNSFGPNSIYGDLSEEEIIIKKAEIITEKAKRKDPLFKSRNQYIEKVKADYEHRNLKWNEYRRKFVEANITQTEDGYFTSLYSYSVGLELIKVYFELKFENYFKHITCPILFLLSEEESINETEKEALKTFRSLLDDSEVKVIKGSAHAQLMFDEPEQFSEHIIEFYKKYF